jgi:hypothetical protein
LKENVRVVKPAEAAEKGTKPDAKQSLIPLPKSKVKYPISYN